MKNSILKPLLTGAALLGVTLASASAQTEIASWDFTNAISGTTAGSSVDVGLGGLLVASTEVTLNSNLTSSDMTADSIWNGDPCSPNGLQWSGGNWVASGELNLQKWDGDVTTSCGINNDGVNDNYMTFTLTAASGTISIDGISMNLWRNGGGAPSGLGMEVSVDGGPSLPFGAVVDVAGAGSSAHAWTAWVDSISGATTVEIRFVPADGAASSGGTGNIHIDGWKITGDVIPGVSNGDAYCFGDGTGATCPCSAFGAAGEGCANTSGVGGTLAAAGDAAFSNDTFVLDGAGLPTTTLGLVLKGDGQVLIPAGDGILCVAGPASSMRSQVEFTSTGTMPFTHFNGAPFGSVANAGGVATHFQLWYRDPANTCTGSGFNFTNAWAVTYLP